MGDDWFNKQKCAISGSPHPDSPAGRDFLWQSFGLPHPEGDAQAQASFPNGTSLWKATTMETFRVPPTFQVGADYLAIGDFKGDGKLDLASGTYGSCIPYIADISVLMNQTK